MIFYKNSNFEKSYNDLIVDLNNIIYVDSVIKDSSTYNVFVKILASLLNDNPVILVNGDLSEKELFGLGINNKLLSEKRLVSADKVENTAKLKGKISEASKWSLTLYTSGTTGLPKKVSHTLNSLARNVKVSDKYDKNVWGFAFNPTHIAGIQVFLQALLNKNSIIDIFKKDRKEIINEINENSITNISATSTFYRLLGPFDFLCNSVSKITFGGEKLDLKLNQELNKCFPNASFRNIYASTEAGTIFTSKGDNFSIPEQYENRVKICDKELVIKSDLLGKVDNFNDEWYYTGDIVEIISNSPLSFRFVHRKNEMISVGGYKINPHEIEEEIRLLKEVKDVKVYGQKNSVLGYILCADIVVNKTIKEVDIRNFLKDKVQNFKIPRIINFVKTLTTTKTGKLQR